MIRYVCFFRFFNGGQKMTSIIINLIMLFCKLDDKRMFENLVSLNSEIDTSIFNLVKIKNSVKPKFIINEKNNLFFDYYHLI